MSKAKINDDMYSIKIVEELFDGHFPSLVRTDNEGGDYDGSEDDGGSSSASSVMAETGVSGEGASTRMMVGEKFKIQKLGRPTKLYLWQGRKCGQRERSRC